MPQPRRILLPLAALALAASGVAPVSVSSAQQCVPSPDNIRNLCIAISSGRADPTGRYMFNYERIILDGACVEEDDSDEIVAQKVQAWWQNHEDLLICDVVGFDVHQGNMLKYAASNRFQNFLFHAAMIWRVNLNRVDASDGRTVLDYVQKEIDTYHGTPVERTLQSYYNMLRGSGALHASELEASPG